MRSKLKSPLAFALVMAAITALAVGVVTLSPEADAADPIKQSRSGICHCPGGTSYDSVKHFTPYETIDECLQADGRHPKQGQGQCITPEQIIEALEAELAAALALSGPSEKCAAYLRWLEGDTPAGWSDVDRTTFGGHPIVKKDYVAGFVGACRE